jgi:ABC-type transport system involved in multi-copper enzyme maturation permease subunit
MIGGPVFEIELITTARRRRYYAARALLGAILLGVLWITYLENVPDRGSRGRVLSISNASRFANQMFTTFGWTQSIAILILTPTLIAGAIADETQRKTLHYLLASRLTSSEIVLGKLFARYLHVVVFVSIGVPIVSLLGLMGGVDPLLVVLLDLGTLTTGFFLAGVSLLTSTFARRVRDAIIATYLLEATWLVLPVVIWSFRFSWPAGFAVLGPVNSWVLSTNPMSFVFATVMLRGTTASLLTAIGWFCGLQMLMGAAFVAAAVWRLRPSFRKSGGELRAFSRSMRGRIRRAQRRRPIGDDPMLWKEIRVGRQGGMLKVIARFVGLLVLAGLGYGVYRLGGPAASELYRHGYAWVTRGESRETYNMFTRTVMILLSGAWVIGVAAVAAAGVTSEREEDTWISLTSSSLTAKEIVFAKILGAPWSLRMLCWTMLGLEVVGLILGSIHPLGFLLHLAVLAGFTWFASALGTFVSLYSKSTTRAMAMTAIIVLITNGGYMLCFIPMRVREGPWIAAGCMPYALYMTQLSYRDVWGIVGFEGQSRVFEGERAGDFLAVVAFAFVFYTSVAAVLTFIATKNFDRILGRPRAGSVRATGRPIGKRVAVELASDAKF